MTNEEALIIFQLMNKVIEVSTPEELKPFSYAFIKNRLILKKVLESNKEIVGAISEMNKIENDEELRKVLTNNEDYNKFLKEESGIELYTMKLDSLEGKEFNCLAVDALIGYIIKE